VLLATGAAVECRIRAEGAGSHLEGRKEGR
jgi:hypothetical protein